MRLVSTAEARKAITELFSLHSLAILSPVNVDGKGQELCVLVQDPSGRCQSRRRCIYQLGVGDVTYMAGVSKKAFKPDSVKVVINFAKQHTEPDIWDYATAHPQAAIKKWLGLRAKVASFDVCQPTRPAGCTDTLQVMVFITANALIIALRASGTDGIFVRPFVERDEDKFVYRAVPMPRDTTLATAIRQAAFYAEKAFGVVPYGSGYGILLKS